MDRYRTKIGSLLRDALSQAIQLLKAEVALARIEATEKLKLAVSSIISLIVAAVFILVALVILLQGVVELLIAKGFATFTANFAVGGGIALIAVVAMVFAARNLSPSRLKPARTLEQVEAAREIVRGPQ